MTFAPFLVVLLVFGVPLLVIGTIVVAICYKVPVIRKALFVTATGLFACFALLLVARYAVSRRHAARVIPGSRVIDLSSHAERAMVVRERPSARVATLSDPDWAKADHWPASIYCSPERAGYALATRLFEKLTELDRPKNAKTFLTLVKG